MSLQLGWPFKSRAAKPEEIAFIEGLSRGFELGLSMASQFDKEAKDKMKTEAINEALERIRGNKTTH